MHTHSIQVKKVDRPSSTSVRLTVELPNDVVIEHEKKTTQKIKNGANLPGFRPGKAPLELIKERYKNEIQQEVLSHLLQHGLYEAIESTKLIPVNQPKINLKDAGTDASRTIIFEAEFEVEPVFELINYKGISLKSRKSDATEDEIDSSLLRLRDRFSVLEPVSVSKPQKGLFGVIKIGYRLIEEPKKVGKPNEFTVELGAGSLLPELESELLQMSIGESKEIKSRYPEDYSDKNLAGKEVVFDCTLIELKKKVLPELDDDFAKQVRPELTLDALKNELREEIQNHKRNEIRALQKEEITHYLSANTQMEIPPSMLSQRKNSILNDLKENHQRQKLNFEPTQENLKTIDERAERLVKSSLILKSIATKEKLELDEKRVGGKVASIAERINKSPEETENLLKDKKMLREIEDEVFVDQVFDFLIDNAIFKD